MISVALPVVCENGLMDSSLRVLQAIEAAIGGDPTAVSDLARFGPDDLEEMRERKLVLHRASVVTVLQGHAAGLWAPEQVQAWASFVRRGRVVGSWSGAIRPLDIEYEQAFEDEIVEAIGRLDEIGDIIDGEVSPEEARDLIRMLYAT